MFILIGGCPFRGYTGTGTFVDLQIVKTYATAQEAKDDLRLDNWQEYYASTGGLIRLINGHSGKMVEITWKDNEVISLEEMNK